MFNPDEFTNTHREEPGVCILEKILSNTSEASLLCTGVCSDLIGTVFHHKKLTHVQFHNYWCCASYNEYKNYKYMY